MQLLDSLSITRGGDERVIELWQGDLTGLTHEQAVDILVVSAYPNDYYPSRHSLMGALYHKGVSVQQLSENKLIDLRQTCSCWLSQPLTTPANLPFKQVLCFEPSTSNSSPADVVGDIFRSLVPFICGPAPMTRVAMPLVSTGAAKSPVVDMMEALFTAAVNWLEHGLPIRRLILMEQSRYKAAELKGAFAILKRNYLRAASPAKTIARYDLFISYSHKNRPEVDFMMAEMKRLRPNLRIFIDQGELLTGEAWQEKLYRSIDNVYKVLAVYSPEYLVSKACQEEYNIAITLHAKTHQDLLFPIYLYSADLPPHFSKWQYMDCREGNQDAMRQACARLVRQIPDE